MYNTHKHTGISMPITLGEFGYRFIFLETRVVTKRRLFNSLVLATAVVDGIAFEMYTPEELRWQKTLLGHTVNVISLESSSSSN